jgi:hypothetical protein
MNPQIQNCLFIVIVLLCEVIAQSVKWWLHTLRLDRIPNHYASDVCFDIDFGNFVFLMFLALHVGFKLLTLQLHNEVTNSNPIHKTGYTDWGFLVFLRACKVTPRQYLKELQLLFVHIFSYAQTADKS